MGFIDLTNISEDDLCDVKYKVKSIIVKPNAGEDHSINVEIEVEMFCRVFGNREISVIQDMYSPSRNLEIKQNKIGTTVNMKNTKSTVNIREKVNLEDDEYSKISDVITNVSINEKNVSFDSVRYTGDLNLRFILMNNEENNMKVQEVNVPFNFSQDINGISEESRIDAEIVPVFEEFSKDGREVSAKIDLEVNTNSYDLETINLIESIEESENTDINPYSMVIYFVKPKDTLWNIAKKYKSTVSDIVRINNIEDPSKISVGMQLFIPKCSKVKKEIVVNS